MVAMSSIVKASSLRASMATEEKSNNDTATAKTVPFAVVSCSSQDEDFPASELNKGVLGRGWQSSRFCFFPQEIVLELQQPSRVVNMQLLCHESKIPSKVEVFVSMMNPYVHSEQAIGQMKRLGYLSLDPNDGSGHHARELKSIYVDSSAAAIRLLLHSCYTNKLNVYNQVGLMAVIITGDPLEGHQQTEYFNRHDVTTPSSHVSIAYVSRIQVACTKGMDAGTRTQAPSPKAVDFDFSEVDSATGTRLRQLFQDKVIAVGNEDYDEAKRLKILIERLKELGKKMKQLERRKSAAVEVEDYDTAKLCKIEMERLQHLDESRLSLEHGQIEKLIKASSDRLDLGTKPPDSLKGRSSWEDMMSASFSSAIDKKETWTQTVVEDANNAVSVQLNKRSVEDSGIISTSCNGILDLKPAYSSFKIQQGGDFQGVTIPAILSNEKQTGLLTPEVLPWYREHSVLKTSEISPLPTVGQQQQQQQGTSAAGAVQRESPQPTTRAPRSPFTTGPNRIMEISEPYLSSSSNDSTSIGSPEKRQQHGTSSLTASPIQHQNAIIASPAPSTSSSAADYQPDLSTSSLVPLFLPLAPNHATSTQITELPELTPLKLHPTLNPNPALNPHFNPNPTSNPTATHTATTGTQYQFEKHHSNSFLPPVSTSPMQDDEEEAEEICTRSPVNSNRIVRSPDNSNRIGRSMDPDTMVRSVDASRIGRSRNATLLIDQGSEGFGLSPGISRESSYYDYHSPAEGTSVSTMKLRGPAAAAQEEQALPFHKGDYFQSNFSTGGDELVPEPLADSVKLEAGPLLSMMEMYQVQCLYSKHWQLREKVLGFLIASLDGTKTPVDEPLPSFRMMNKVLLRTLTDRVANVFNTSLQLLRAVVTTYAPTVPHRDLHISSSNFTSILLEKLGDLNARTKEGSFETLMFLASKKEIGIHVLSGPLLKPSKNQGIWRPVLGRLQLLLHAVPLYGIQPPSRTGFPCDALMNFVTQAFNSPNGEVRNAAIKVTIEVFRLMGPPIEKYLKGIKPLIKEILASNFERIAYESEQGEENPYHNSSQERPFSGEEPAPRSATRAAQSQSIGLRPLVQDDSEDQEFCGSKGHETTASFSKTDGSSNRSSLSGQENPRAEGDIFETPVAEVESPTTKGSLSSYNNNQAATITTASAVKVHESVWVHSHQESSASPVEESGDLVDASEAAGDSVRSHCSDGEASLDTSNYAPQIAVDESSSLMEKDENVDSCLFCGKQDARFKEGDNLDLHFCEQCPMLASCSNCGQIVEISSLKDHYLFECASGKRYVECQKCYLAVPETRLAAHQKSQDCKMCKQHKLLRCPLCYRTVEPSDKGWRDHILLQPGCLRNPRTLTIHAS